MNLQITKKEVDKLKLKSAALQIDSRWASSDHQFDVAFSELTQDDLAKLTAAAQSNQYGFARRVKAYNNITKNPTDIRYSRLSDLKAGLEQILKKLPNHLVFEFDPNTELYCPYLVTHVEIIVPKRTDGSPYLNITGAYGEANSDDTRTSFSFFRPIKETVSEVLARKNLFLETEKLVAEYLKQRSYFEEIRTQIGRQFVGTGTGQTIADADDDDNSSRRNYWYSSKRVALNYNGYPVKLVLDENEVTQRQVDISIYCDAAKVAENDDDEDQEADAPETVNIAAENEKRLEAQKLHTLDIVPWPEYVPQMSERVSMFAPIHLGLCVFDLERHTYLDVPAPNLTHYVFDKTLGERLVLPMETKNLISILIQGSVEISEDIIKGKTGGVIVLATGEPGTGKTLSAEVFAECMEKPLYMVQCSQLGMDLDTIEKRLSKTLRRAEKWGAVLLIDEADVYIHERGTGMEQNAVVGVFLRLLERYRGVLFLTSNRATVIDDAILSRATAWLRYNKPKPDELRKIWHILAKQYQHDLSNADVDKIVDEMPFLSGRNVKHMLKLAELLSKKKNQPVDYALLKHVSNFLALDRPDGNPKYEQKVIEQQVEATRMQAARESIHKKNLF